MSSHLHTDCVRSLAITDHALLRYRQRFAQSLTYWQARGELERVCRVLTPWRRGGGHGHVYRSLVRADVAVLVVRREIISVWQAPLYANVDRHLRVPHAVLVALAEMLRVRTDTAARLLADGLPRAMVLDPPEGWVRTDLLIARCSSGLLAQVTFFVARDGRVEGIAHEGAREGETNGIE